jgi:hypothetical protein
MYKHINLPILVGCLGGPILLATGVLAAMLPAHALPTTPTHVVYLPHVAKEASAASTPTGTPTSGSTSTATATASRTPTATVTPSATPTSTATPGDVIYASRNLGGHAIYAECFYRGTSGCECGPDDASIASYGDYGEVTANPQGHRTFVDAIGYRKFIETLPNGYPITLGAYRYAGEFRLTAIPHPNPAQLANGESIHAMVQLWDGRNALYQSNRTTLEGTLFWSLNPWDANYKKIRIYTYPLTLIDTGIILTPDTIWHSFELAVDTVSQRYLYIAIDGRRVDLSGTRLAQVYQPNWGSEVSLAITTESGNANPGAGCPNIFKWTLQFRNLKFGYIR